MGRINSDAFYAGPVPLGQAYWRAVDTAQSKALNGDAGGTWSPAGTLTIAGPTPLWLAGPSSISGAGALVRTPAGSGKRFVHGDGDYFALGGSHTGQTRVIVTPCLAAYGTNVTTDNTHACASSSGNADFFVPLRLQDGAKFAQVVFNCSAVATTQRFRVVRLGADGTITPVAHGGAFDPNGFKSPASSVGTTFTYTFGSTVIDLANFTYLAEIADVAGVLYFNVASSITGIGDLRPQ